MIISDEILKERLFKKRIIYKGCWIFTGAKGGTKSKYGTLSNGEKMEQVHRISYRIFKGELTPGLVIDHLCNSKTCFNPKHLELVTSHENLRRSHGYHDGHKIKLKNPYIPIRKKITGEDAKKMQKISWQSQVKSAGGLEEMKVKMSEMAKKRHEMNRLK